MIRIALCDDETDILQELKNTIAQLCAENKTACVFSLYTSGEALLEGLAQPGDFHLIFLDIKMGHINGVQAAQEIRRRWPDLPLVFVTALQEYVFDAFQVGALNYLVKPIRPDQMRVILHKILDRQARPQDLVIRERGQVYKLSTADILYCEAADHLIYIYQTQKMNECRCKLDALEKQLAGKLLRCHRSYLINLQYVTHYAEGYAFLASGEKIPVAARRKQQFMQALLHYKRNEVL